MINIVVMGVVDTLVLDWFNSWVSFFGVFLGVPGMSFCGFPVWLKKLSKTILKIHTGPFLRAMSLCRTSKD